MKGILVYLFTAAWLSASSAFVTDLPSFATTTNSLLNSISSLSSKQQQQHTKRVRIVTNLSSSKTEISSFTNAREPFTQVISDVDDTLKSSGGVNIGGVALGGIDIQYDRGTFYPGVFQFMLELSSYPHIRVPSSSKKEVEKENIVMQPPKVAVLTARAEEFKVALELKKGSKLAKAFEGAGKKYGFMDWGLGPVLYGSVAEWVIQDRKGLRKFSNFERLLQQDPTGGKMLQYVYVGDTGELDQEAGETMLREYPDLVKAVFLHVVSDDEDLVYHKTASGLGVPIPPAKLINGRPLVFFRTYVGAAAKATQLGLMDKKGLLRVVNAAEEALQNVDKSSHKWADLDRDIADAVRTLGL